MAGLSVVCLLLTAVGADAHLEVNSLYRELIEQGVELAPEVRLALPPPTMQDELSTDVQRSILEELAGKDYTIKQLLRKSVVSRHIFRMQQLPDERAPARRADTWFVAYGDLDVIAEKEFLEGLLSSQEDDDSIDDDGHELTLSELASRDIHLAPEAEQYESYSHSSYKLIKRVEVTATMHSVWSRTPDSIVVAARIDPRFHGDSEFPNQWRPLERGATRGKTPGSPRPYQGMALYLKITRLAEPAGALFVESHVVFSEPYDWFDGANLLGSKLPAVVQRTVRTTRREIMRATRDQAQARAR